MVDNLKFVKNETVRVENNQSFNGSCDYNSTMNIVTFLFTSFDTLPYFQGKCY